MLAAYLLLPLVCLLAAGAGGRRGAERIVAGVALCQALLFVLGTALGFAQRLVPGAYGLVTVAATGVLAVPAWRNRPSLSLDLRPLRTRMGAGLAIAGLLVAVTVILQLARDAAWGTGHADGLWYHLPRIVRWAGQGSFEPWTTPTWAQIGLPVGADVVLGAKVFLGLGWNGMAFVPALLTVGAVAAIYLAARELGLGRTRSWLAALLFASFPAIGRRIGAVNSDIAAAFPVLAASVLLLRGRGPWRLGIFLFLNGLAVACRPTVAPLALIVAVVSLWRSRKTLRLDGRALAGALAGFAAVAASYGPVVAAFGDPLGGAFGRAHAPAGAVGFLRGVAVSTAQWAMEPLGYLPGARLQAWGREGAWRVLVALGAPFPGGPYAASQGMLAWTSYRAADVARSGLVPLLVFPWVAARLPAQARRVGLGAWILGSSPRAGWSTCSLGRAASRSSCSPVTRFSGRAPGSSPGGGDFSSPSLS